MQKITSILFVHDRMYFPALNIRLENDSKIIMFDLFVWLLRTCILLTSNDFGRDLK